MIMRWTKDIKVDLSLGNIPGDGESSEYPEVRFYSLNMGEEKLNGNK